MEGQWEVPVIEGDRQSETFVLSKSKQFRIRIAEEIWEFEEGDTVTVQWEPSKVLVNDIQIVPDPSPRRVLSFEEAMSRYGDIPFVKQYVAEHDGEASKDEIATRAVEAWSETILDLVRQASRRFARGLVSMPPRTAAEEAAEFIRNSGFADTVGVMLENPPESEAQDLIVIWKGERGKIGAMTVVPLRPRERHLAPPSVTAKRVYASLTGALELLTYGDNHLAVGFEGGALLIDGNIIADPKGARQ